MVHGMSKVTFKNVELTNLIYKTFQPYNYYYCNKFTVIIKMKEEYKKYIKEFAEKVKIKLKQNKF